jgi:uncharacterized membrane protein
MDSEFLLVLGAAVLLAIPVALVVLMIAVSTLRRRLAALEVEVARLQPRTPITPASTSPLQTTPMQATAPVPEAALPQEPSLLQEPPPLPPSGAPETPWAVPPIAHDAAGEKEGPVVLNAARVSALADWLRDNWVYAVSALSLAFAGIFFVQYGVENGLLPPSLRVAMAILFGFALVVAGEWIRRRYGDGKDVSTAYLPSTFSGAGIVSMFGGVLAGRQLYGLIGVEVAFAGLCAVALLALVLGWFYGPFLAAVGLIGATAAPFIVGGSSDAPYWLYGYFAIITAIGLGIDAQRRWAWVSVLALVLGYGGGVMVYLGSGGAGWFALFATVQALVAVLLPARGFAPDHNGPMLSETLFAAGKSGWPNFPTRLAAASVTLSVAILTLVEGGAAADSLMAFFCLTGLALALMFWSAKAPALADLAFVPAAGLLVRLGFEGLNGWPMAAEYARAAIALRAPESAAPMTAAVLLALSTALTLMAAWRSARSNYSAFWAAGSALIAPLAAVVLELAWAPSTVIGAYPWALHVIALAAMMAFLAQRFAAQDGEDRRRFAYATLSTLSLIALALFLVTTKGALTLALAILVVAASWLDRRFRLPEMGWFMQAGVLLLSYRLVVDPGLAWAIDAAQLWEVLASYGGAVLGMIAGLRLLEGMDRRGPRVFLESAGAGYAALLANVLIMRWLTQGVSEDWVFTHWALSLNAMPWLIMALIQLYRLQLGGALRWLRWAIAGVAGLLAAGGMIAAVGPANPVLGLFFGGPEGLVYGTYIFDTLLVAYGLPALLLLAAASRMKHLADWLRYGLLAIGAALAALYICLEIRRFWRGDDLSVLGVTQAELYSYTIALMVLGAALLYQAIARRSPLLRRAAMAVIAVTVAKVFLVDASGLSGLTRVFSFLALGLSLAGLAWLNRWAAGQQSSDTA